MSSLNAPQNPLRHLPGLPSGLPAVNTVAFRKTQMVARQAAADGSIAAFTGKAGLGKTFSVDHAVRSLDLGWVWVQIGPAPTPKEVTLRLLKALVGGFPAGALYELTDELVGVLVDEPRVVVIDDAQNLNKRGLEQVRYLHDLGCGAFPLFLVGGEQCAETLASDPQLADRVGAWMKFKPLSGKELHATLASYHPFYARSDRGLLDEVDSRYARGRFRRWAAFLKTALRLADNADTDRLTPTVIKAALSVLLDGRAA